MPAIACRNGYRRRGIEARGVRIDHGAGPEHQAQQFSERLQTAQGLRIDQPQQVASPLKVLPDLLHFDRLQIDLRVCDQQHAGIGGHFLRDPEIEGVGPETLGFEPLAEFTEIVIGDAIQAALAVSVERHHQALARAREPHQCIDERLLVVIGQALAFPVVLDHGLAVDADAGRLREPGFFARVDETQADVGFDALIARQEVLHLFAQVAAHILAHGESGYLDRPAKLDQHFARLL